MDPVTVGVLITGVVELFAGGIVAACGLALLWSYSKLRPQEQLEVDVRAQRMLIDNLEAQVIRLRTQRAGARSAQKKAQAAEPEPEDQDDPLLAGLTEEDRALFQ